jgi:dTDP-glucose 4,6-dehydratase
MSEAKTYLVTGGCGFIGSHFVLQEIAKGNRIINLDVMSYAADTRNVEAVENSDLYHFVKGDIGDQVLVKDLLEKHEVDAVINFAAESHVDNSITGPEIFYQTNVMGTYGLLWAGRQYWEENGKPADFRFIHVSTDEVFGDLPLEGNEKFRETTPYSPSSPYSSSKAASDHMVHAWHRTYGLPAIITNCSNNFGPHQHAEKLIPTVIRTALAGKNIPVYGKGENVRDWIYVGDHCHGVALALEKGAPGDTYCLGGNSERRNIDLVRRICTILDELKPREDGKSYTDQITFVTERKGHDLRYAIDDTKAQSELGYQASLPFEERLAQTVQWYLDHENRYRSA